MQGKPQNSTIIEKTHEESKPNSTIMRNEMEEREMADLEEGK